MFSINLNRAAIEIHFHLFLGNTFSYLGLFCLLLRLQLQDNVVQLRTVIQNQKVAKQTNFQK